MARRVPGFRVRGLKPAPRDDNGGLPHPLSFFIAHLISSKIAGSSFFPSPLVGEGAERSEAGEGSGLKLRH